MSFVRHIEARFARALAILGLPEAAAHVMQALVVVDLEGPSKPDVHGRQGILTWQQLVEQLEAQLSIPQVEDVVVQLADWGLLQIVGRGPSDPRLSGVAALRLTHAGRVATGLAPHVWARATVQTTETGWTILHHANREGVVMAATALVGELGFRPLVPSTDRSQLAFLAGNIAASLVTTGAAVVDGFLLSETERARDLPDLLWRTRTAKGPCYLMLPEPQPVRAMAAAIGARARWVEPEGETRRDDGNLDRRVTDALMSSSSTGHNDVASACGVPRSNLARPKRVHVSFEDLIVPEGVRRQIEQACMHADFRLNVLPNKSAFVGKGGGFRLLLSGLPGTGKSMMAEALATRLDRSVVKLDLSTVLSKWLGETEQQIGQIFDLAEASNSVLVLDEAEALFRQRNSGGSSGANAMLTAVAYLLTRLDRFEGVLVATTNRTQDIDDALYRRFDDFIILPVPDHATRVELWRRMLLQGLGDTQDFSDRDFDALGKHFVITGGLIRGAAIRAGAWASGHGKAVAMPYVLASLARELEKSDHPTTGVLMQPYRARVAELLNDDRYSATV